MNQQPTVALLASRCPSVIEQVNEVTREVANVEVEVCTIRSASARTEQTPIGLVLAHLGGGEESGITNLIWSLAQGRRACPTVILCNRSEEQQAQALLRAGAADYVTLPNERERLRFLLTVLTRRFRPTRRDTTTTLGTTPDDVATEGFAQLMAQVGRVAPQETTVMLTGETGTGKTRLARLIHELSPRRDLPFLTLDCGSLSASLIESELFGHCRGAFSGADRDRPGKLAAAGAGTLFIDEVNTLPLALQSKLLRAVDERVFESVGSEKSQPVRARLIAASNAPLETEVVAGRFRADLYYRLNVVSFFLPPLRDRRDSIVPLARNFLREAAERNGRDDVTGFSPDAEHLLSAFDWPGNVRELRNVIERAVALCPTSVIEDGDLPEAIRQAAGRANVLTLPTDCNVVGLSLAQSKDELEIQRIQAALSKHNNKRASAARELGISRVGLYKKLRKYGFFDPPFANGEDEATLPVGQVISPGAVVPDVPMIVTSEESACADQ